MPTFLFEAMDAKGQEIRDEIEAPSEDEAQTTIRQMGYFVTKIQVKKVAAQATAKKKGRKGFAMGALRQSMSAHSLVSYRFCKTRVCRSFVVSRFLKITRSLGN